jgi:1-acyl-sn-glycerol-3-phosphate acyltransferase
MMSPFMWDAGRALLRPILRLGFRFSREGAERVPRAGGVLIVCNHLSLWDPPFVGSAAKPRRVYFMAKSELFRFKPFGWLIERVGAFPVARGGVDRDAIRMAREILKRGDAMVMFPEGTRSLSGRLRPFFPGAGLMALEDGVTVIPAAVWGSQHRFGPVRVVFGDPVDFGDLPDGAKSERARLATTRIAQAVADLVPAAGGPPQRVADGEPSLERY